MALTIQTILASSNEFEDIPVSRSYLSILIKRPIIILIIKPFSDQKVFNNEQWAINFETTKSRRRKPVLETKITKIEEQLKAVLGKNALEVLAKQTGFIQRKRTVTATGFIGSLLYSLGTRKVETIADLHRDFNHHNDNFINYKPYYEKIDTEAFPEMMRILFESMLNAMCLQVLSPLKNGPFNSFRDIIVHDGSSFALHDTLCDVFPGRFTRISPAAVELHATMSLFSDNLTAVKITADSECERHYTPDAKDLSQKLFMGDRGYDSTDIMKAIERNDGHFLIRIRSILKPIVTKIRRVGRRYQRLEGKRLDEVLKAVPKRKLLDMDVCWQKRNGQFERCFRLIAKYNWSDKSWMRLMTNLPIRSFSTKTVLKAYRLRWQIELYFKELKSYANLHPFCTRKSNIAEGLLWASLCVAFLKRFFAHTCQYISFGAQISTRRVAMCGHAFLGPILRTMLNGFHGLKQNLIRAFQFLSQNATRSNPKRERKTGRLACGFVSVGRIG